MESQGFNRVGRLASILAALEVSLFAIFLVSGFWVNTDIASFITCFFLAPTIVVMIACIHDKAATNKKSWSLISLVFAAIYTVMCTMTYYIQVAVIRPHQTDASPAYAMFRFTPGTVMFAVDMLGYVFLTLAVLFLIPVFGNGKKEKILKFFLKFQGIYIIPTLIFPCLSFFSSGAGSQTANRIGSISLIFWCLLFVPIPLILIGYFQGKTKKNSI